MDERPHDLLEHLKAYGNETTSFQTLEPGYSYFRTGPSIIPFVETSKAWISAGSPIGPNSNQVAATEHFMRSAKQHGRKAIWFALEDKASPNLSYHNIGRQPFWSTDAWPITLKSVKSLREQLRRARSKNVVVRPLSKREIESSAERIAMKQLIFDWSRKHTLAPMKYLVDTEVFGDDDERRYFVAMQGSKYVGLLVTVPIYQKQRWFFEHLFRTPDAPNGVSELLFDAAIRCAAVEKIHQVTTGLVPLADIESKGLKLIRHHTRGLYNFEGLYAFKKKLRPDFWEPVYLAHSPDISFSFAIIEVLRAFAGGSFVQYGLATLKHQASRVATKSRRQLRVSFR